MPKLIRLYITNVAIGFAISAAFLAGLLYLDVMGLRHLLLETPSGWLAAFMIFMFQGSIFAGVQFGIAVMGLSEKPKGPRGGTRAPTGQLIPVPVKASTRRR